MGNGLNNEPINNRWTQLNWPAIGSESRLVNLGDDDNILCTYRVDSTANFPSSAKGLENALINQLMQRVGSERFRESRSCVYLRSTVQLELNWNATLVGWSSVVTKWQSQHETSDEDKVDLFAWSSCWRFVWMFRCTAGTWNTSRLPHKREREGEITRKAAIRNTGNRPLLLLL